MDPNVAFDVAKAGTVVIGLTQVARTAGIEARWLPVVATVAGVAVVLLTAFAGPLGGVLLDGLALGLGSTGVVTLVVHNGTGTTGSADGGAS